jgi:tetratricopeptide (TPR) repeat protein
VVDVQRAVRPIRKSAAKASAAKRTEMTATPVNNVSSQDLLDEAAEDESTGQYDDALTALRAAAVDPNTRQEALLRIGDVCDQMGMTDSAVEAYYSALGTSSAPPSDDERNQG